MRATFAGALLACAMPLRAIEIVECKSPSGEVRYQDRPCAADEATRTIKLADDPPAASRAPIADVPDERPTEDKARIAIQRAPPRARMAPSHLCTREDGSRYLAESGFGERRLVPLAMLGIPGRGLADAYRRGGAGISAPGVRAPLAEPGSHPGYGGGHVWVEDACEPVSGEAVCAFLAGEIRAAERRLRFAFSDRTAQIGAEITRLRERAAPCAD